MFPLILMMATVISLTAIIGGLMLEHSKLKHKNKNDGELDRLWDEILYLRERVETLEAKAGSQRERKVDIEEEEVWAGRSNLENDLKRERTR